VAAPPRQLTFHLTGDIRHAAATHHLERTYHASPPSENGGRVELEYLVGRDETGELVFEFFAMAQFPDTHDDRDDDDTVIVSYWAGLYDDNGVCQHDTSPLSSGERLDCRGRLHQENWTRFKLDSSVYASPPVSYNLQGANPYSNAASFTVSSEIDW